MFCLGAASTATLVHFGYDNLVAHYGDPLYILKLNWVSPAPTSVRLPCPAPRTFLSLPPSHIR